MIARRSKFNQIRWTTDSIPMKKPLAAALLLLTSASWIAVAIQDPSEQEPPAQSPALAQHDWLQQLVGEWDVTQRVNLDPELGPTVWESTEVVRAIGDLWVVSEGSAEYDGAPFMSILTLGYDPAKEKFVGTWIDSIQTTLWNYTGELDAERHRLTLMTEGPSLTEPSKTVPYRDSIEILGPGHRRMTSSAKDEDGEWAVFMTADAVRKQ